MTTQLYVDVLQSHVQISGMDHPLALVIVDGEEGLLSTQVEDLFGYSQFKIRLAMNSDGHQHRKISGAALSILKMEGIANLRATQAIFVSRDALRMIVGRIGSIDDRMLYDSIWSPLTEKPERALPRKGFRSGMIRAAKRHSEKIRRLELEVSELRAVVEDLMREDMKKMTMALSKVCPEHCHPLSLGSGGDHAPRGQFSGY
jgi:hypothetical protein